MSCACLIPYYRLDKINNAVDSAIKDGWKIETKFDKNKIGPAKIREVLLNDIFVNNDIKFIRYLDDDDILLPHLKQITDIFEANKNIDIIYTNYILNTPFNTQHEIKHLGNPLEDIAEMHPWSWIARIEALHKIKNIYCNLWDYEKSCREGTYCWMKFLNAGLKIMHVPIPAYQYNKTLSLNCVSQHPTFIKESENAYKMIKDFKARYNVKNI